EGSEIAIPDAHAATIVHLWDEHVSEHVDLRRALLLTPSPATPADALAYFRVAERTSPEPSPPSVPTQERARLNNYAKRTNRVENGRRFFEWMAFVDRPPDFLKTIREVEYRPHATYVGAEPETKRDPGNAFAYHGQAYGGHTLLATVRYHDGREDLISYW